MYRSVRFQGAFSHNNTVVSNILLEVPRCRSVRFQGAFSHNSTVLWNSITSAVDVTRMSTKQVKCSAHTWLRERPPDSEQGND